MKRIVLIASMVAVILLQVWVYFQYGWQPILLKADTFDSYVDYSYFLVTDFDDYNTIVTPNTPDVNYYVRAVGEFDYSVSYCPAGGLIGTINIVVLMGKVYGTWLSMAATLPTNLYCIEPYETYSYDVTLPVSLSFDMTENLFSMSGDDGVIFNTYIRLQPAVPMSGYTFTIDDFLVRNWLEVDFNNSYLLSTFLLDSDFIGSYGGSAGRIARPFLLYAVSGSDLYNVYNNELIDVPTRYKYAIEIPEVDSAIVVQKIGTGWQTQHNNPQNYTLTTSTLFFNSVWQVFGFNASPMGTPFDASTIDTTPNYAVCDYALFGFPVNCTIDSVPVNSFQAMANDVWEWVTKKSPLVSDILSIASSGFQWLDNSLQFLGFFSPTTLLGAGLWVGIAVLLIAYGFNGGE